MFRAKASLWGRFRLAQIKSFCTNNTMHNTNNNSNKIESNLSRYHEAYKQLDKLDFMTAVKMLFTEPPKKKKFGIDFHLVQLFFACMPSLAVYLVAQYARYEMRRMEAELEQKKEQEEKKKREEEEKSKELELKEAEEIAKSNPKLLEVKTRLGKLEEAVKEIVVESKKQSSGSITKDLEDANEKKHHTKSALGDTQNSLESNNPVEKDHLDNQKSGESTIGFGQSKLSGSAPSNVAPYQDQMSKTENREPSNDAKR